MGQLIITATNSHNGFLLIYSIIQLHNKYATTVLLTEKYLPLQLQIY